MQDFFFQFTSKLFDTIKRLMSSSKCRSVEVINNPVRPGSNHREVNCINYKKQYYNNNNNNNNSNSNSNSNNNNITNNNSNSNIIIIIIMKKKKKKKKKLMRILR